MKVSRPSLSCVHAPPPRDVVTVADALLAFVAPVLLLLFALTESCQ